MALKTVGTLHTNKVLCNYSALLEGIKENAQKGGLGKGLTTIKNRDVFVEPTGRYSRRAGKPLTRLPACT